ncbi:MAG TPA: hypothetical protein VE130_16060 [Nitrososphaeraceae archaeon]|jgi:hypothetical protein|nr:hypothetical protein [Nitrososphaeraceae archaeon]
MKGINLEERDDPDIEILRTSQDGRIQHIRIRDNVTAEKAIRRKRFILIMVHKDYRASTETQKELSKAQL